MLAFDEAFINESDNNLLRSPLFYEADVSPVISVIHRKNIAELWKQIGDEFKQHRSDYELALQSLLRLLLVSAHRTAAEIASNGQKSSAASARIYQRFIKLLSGDIPENHLPKHYAQQLKVSVDYLSECVRLHSGHNTSELLHRRITLESKRLLAHSDLTVSEIAYHLHFKDPSYFSRFFKRNTNQLPKEFRGNA